MGKILVTTVPFSSASSIPLELLNETGHEVIINPLNRKLSEQDLFTLVSEIKGIEAIVAGTETISRRIMVKANHLRLISRVGIGLDGIDLLAAKELSIQVAYTPEAPAPAVAELTMGLMLSLLRSIHLANGNMHKGEWQRLFGRRIAEVSIGIVGVGRIGSRVMRRCTSFGTPNILANDLLPQSDLDREFKIDWMSKEEIYKKADVISLHLPLTSKTKNMIGKQELLSMKPDAMIINTSRGGIINEKDLAAVLESGHLSGAAIDVFEQEPYSGSLSNIDNCILTSHMGSMSVDCRARMELEATKEIVRLYRGEAISSPVPESEYLVQKEGL